MQWPVEDLYRQTDLKGFAQCNETFKDRLKPRLYTQTARSIKRTSYLC